MENEIKLKSLIPTESSLNKRLIWVKFKGIEFQIRYVSRATLSAIADQCIVAGFDNQRKLRSRSLDPQKFARKMASTIVHDWKGVTLKALSELMPIDVDTMLSEDLLKELPFDQENLFMIVENTHDLDTFLQECSVDASLFKAENSEDVEKNSESSQNGN